MTIKEDLHALVDELDETDARDALEFFKARAALDQCVSELYIADCEAARADAHSGNAALLPDEDVRAWLEAWGTPDEAAADREVEALEERLMKEARDRGLQ